MVNDVKECLKWLKDKCDISFLTNKKQEEIVDLVLQWDAENGFQRFKSKKESYEKQKEIERTREDYKEVVDENGRTWYEETHIESQRPESRKLSKGDAIIFKSTLNSDGFMLVDSFDFKSDFAARAYFTIFTHKHVENGKFTETSYRLAGSDMAPGIDTFSFATKDEIKKYINEYKERNYFDYMLAFHSSITPNWIKEKYEDCIPEEPIEFEEYRDNYYAEVRAKYQKAN